MHSLAPCAFCIEDKTIEVQVMGETTGVHEQKQVERAKGKVAQADTCEQRVPCMHMQHV